MRFVIQRVTESSVKVDGKVIGQIGKGFMVLIGVADSDTKEIADKMVKKMTGLRIFEDEESFTGCGGRGTPSDLAVYFICELQKGKPAKFCRSRETGHGRRTLRIYYQ